MDAKIVKRNDSASFSCGKNHGDAKIYGFRRVSQMLQATQITIKKPQSHDKPTSASSAFLKEKPSHEAMMDFQNSTQLLFRQTKETMRKIISSALCILGMSFFLSCDGNKEGLEKGKYAVVSVDFAEGTSPEEMAKYVSTFKPFEVTDCAFVLSQDSSVSYKYDEGYLYIGKDEKKYECEPMPSSGNMSYEILLNEGILKKVVIQKVKE